ncbi:hypothetical protein [Phormidium sp. CCY1219]|uniref:hypothetical protein n=1 Tax=Phormidium sp. CCY1219 TaxID=2886104 RepID=UPI002D1F7FCE|nr:hypothetical protein [Phormidium sp. CCY1219]MEB3830315.1 hypothetical protein [Phormidium sp. CCY1219]
MQCHLQGDTKGEKRRVRGRSQHETPGRGGERRVLTNSDRSVKIGNAQTKNAAIDPLRVLVNWYDFYLAR